MWIKAIIFGDRETADKIMAETSPKKMQDFGRTVKNYNDKIWDAKRDSALDAIEYARCTQIDYLNTLLLSTGDAILVEASPIDSIWGIGLSVEDAKKTPDTEWPGQNRLGKCMTRVKNMIKAETANK